jgi:hypothetical protein
LQAFLARFEYETEQDREPLTYFFEETSPMIGNLVGQIISKSDSKAMEILLMICEVFHTSNNL